MDKPDAPDTSTNKQRGRAPRFNVALLKTLGSVALIIALVLSAHLRFGMPTHDRSTSTDSGWEQFRSAYAVDGFGEDGNFVRGVKNGYHLVHHTHQYAQRFTRKTADDRVNTCVACHTPADLAYSFVNSDRFDPKLGKRVSFEERVMRCYAGPMDGFVPTLYDPAVRDIRLFARAIAHHLQLSEGALKDGG